MTELLIVGVFVILVAVAVWWNKQNTDPAEQACAREIGALLKADRDAKPQAIADVFSKHGIARSRCKQVGRLVMPQLRKHGLNPEDAKIAMIQVRAAYSLVPSKPDQHSSFP